MEAVVACHVFVNGRPSCRIGFLPKCYINIRHVFVDRFATVTELYKESDSAHKRRQDFRNKGMGVCHLFSAE